jgi:hypothetical protein
MLNNISYFKTFETKQFNISIIVISNESGSAHQEGTDEVSNKVYIGVSEFDENPKQMLYSIDNLYLTKNFKIVEKSTNDIRLKFNYVDALKPINVEIKITNQGLTKL